MAASGVCDDGYSVVSFDVGIRNLAFAVVRAIPGEVSGSGSGGGARLSLERWETIDLGDKVSGATVVSDVVAALDAADLLGHDVVLIENQPCMKNPRMKTVQVAIHTYFEAIRLLVGPERGLTEPVRLVNASNKVRGASLSYADRKRISVERTRAWLASDLVVDEGGGGSALTREAALGVLAAAKKKDDLCDALMQAVWYVCASRTGIRP
jgi:hypothetical protein